MNGIKKCLVVWLRSLFHLKKLTRIQMNKIVFDLTN